MSVLNNLTGRRIGIRTIVERAGADSSGSAVWRVRCDCGNETKATGRALARSQSCGCTRRGRPPKNVEDMTGLRFGKWTVIERNGSKRDKAAWLCRCDCGTERTHTGQNLRRTKSCGCAGLVHGHARKGAVSPTYVTWQAMVKRCEYPGRWNFKYWGGRGITVCERWRVGDGKRSGFECFYADMGPKPFGLSLDRTDNDKGYSPDNCRWTTRIGQARNRRRTERVTPELAARQRLAAWLLAA